MLTSSPGQGRSSWRNTNNISPVIMSSAEVLTPLSGRTLSKPNQTKRDCAVGAEQTGLHSTSCLNLSCGQWDKCSIFIQYHFLHLSLALTPSIRLCGNSSISHSSVWSPSYSQAFTYHKVQRRGNSSFCSCKHVYRHYFSTQDLWSVRVLLLTQSSLKYQK